MFPGKEVVQLADNLSKTPNLQVTEVSGMTVNEIVAKVESMDGNVLVNITKASEGEKKALHEVASCLPEGKLELFVNTNEDFLLQMIVVELCDQPELFLKYLVALLDQGQEHYEDEWNKFVVAHEVAGKAKSIEDTHHWANIGLSATDHPLREKVRRLIINVPAELPDNLNLNPHPFITSVEDVLFALLLAMVSNFVRGGVYYGLLSPEKCQSYLPRKVAYSLVFGS